MHKLSRRIALILLAIIIATGVMPVSASAADTAPAVADQGTITTDEFTFAPHITDHDLTDSIVYTDDYFSFPSDIYNPHLAVATSDYAWASIGSQNAINEDAPLQQSQNAQALLESLGFTDFETNDDFKVIPYTTTDTFGVYCAAKTIHVNGKDYTLFALAGRNANYLAEWGGNFRMGKGTDSSSPSEGFARGRDKEVSFFKEYAASYFKNHTDAPKRVKLWMNGYSRGAAIANISAAYIADHKTTVLPAGTTLNNSDIFAYCFGTPKPAYKISAKKAASYSFIHNIYASYDHVTMVPMSGMGFTRFGDWHELNPGYNKATGEDPEREAEMMAFLKNLNTDLYNAYVDGSQNPTAVTVMRFKDDGSFQTESDPENANDIPDNLGDFMQSTYDNVSRISDNDRNVYTDKYQPQLMQLVKVVKGDRSGKMSELTTNLKESDSIKSTALVCLAYYLLDRFVDENGDGDAASTEPLKNVLYQAICAAIKSLEDDYEYSVPPETLEYIKADINAAIDKMQSSSNLAAARDYLQRAAGKLLGEELAQAMAKSHFTEEEIADITGSDEEHVASANLLKIATTLLLSGENETFNIFTITEESGDVTPVDADTDLSSVTAGKIKLNWHCYQLTRLATLMAMFDTTTMAHANEFICSWLKTQDSYWSDEYDKTGYRTFYVKADTRKSVKLSVIGKESKIYLTLKGSSLSRQDKTTDGSKFNTDIYTNVKDGVAEITLPLGRDYIVKLVPEAKAKIDSSFMEFDHNGQAAGDPVTFDRISLSAGSKLVYDCPKGDADKKLGSAAYDVDRVARVSISKATAGKSSIRLSWKKINSPTSPITYRVAYKRVHTKTWKKVNTKNTYKTISKLRKGKYYYVKVRAFKEFKGTDYYSSWSKIKKIKVK